MAQRHGALPLSELAAKIGAEIIGSGSGLISKAVPAGSPDPEGITFAVSPKHLRLALGGEIGAVIVARGTGPQSAPTLEVDEPRAAFMAILAHFDRPWAIERQIHPTAVVDPSAQVGEGAAIGAYAVIEEGAVVGDGAQIHPHSVVGARAVVGEGTILYPRVTLYPDVVVGRRCILHSGCVLGADGFGFVFAGGKQVKIPQVGRVVLGDEVEIGANACIDRATCGDTVIASGVKLDNLVMVGHNSRIGSHTVIASLTGISGSTTVGERCVFGGQVGIGDHAHVADDVHLGGQAGVSGRVESGAYMGTPLMPVQSALRTYAHLRRLPEMVERLKRVEEELEAQKRGV